MLFLLILLSVILLGNTFYQRYVPVQGVPRINIDSGLLATNTVLLDIRDYHEAAKEPIKGAYNLPSAYLKRHHYNIKAQDVVIIASDSLSKNIGIRFLRRKGFHVLGYALMGSSNQIQPTKNFETKGGSCGWSIMNR